MELKKKKNMKNMTEVELSLPYRRFTGGMNIELGCKEKTTCLHGSFIQILEVLPD